jgi:PPOX class probable F420-dependent enzyme
MLEDSRVGRLGLLDDQSRPRVLPVTYALSNGALISAVDHKRKRVTGEQLARVRWLRARPQAALTVDRYADDWSELAWVQAIGEVTIIDAGSASKEIAALTARYQQYSAHPPAGPILVLRPDRLLWWRAQPEPAAKLRRDVHHRRESRRS